MNLHIDFVSDISCPWCAVGLWSLEQALESLQGEVSAELHFQPFELNPQMPPGGQDVSEHLTQKYGSTPEQQVQIRAAIAQRGREVGFEFNPGGRGRIYNTFNAHRLLHWAALQSPGQELALKKALLLACHHDSQSMESHDVLLQAVADAGLDTLIADGILNSDEFTAEVRQQQAFYARQGIRAVPAVVINGRHLISGGQPPEAYAQALRQIALEPLAS
jgi:predicted DsbA family dithiol-disulfide isomerase